MKPLARRVLWGTLIAAGVAGAAGAGWIAHTGMPPGLAIEQAARMALAATGSVLFRQDLKESRRLSSTDFIGEQSAADLPFVFERSDAPHLIALRKRHDLDSVIAGATTEYDAQLRLAAWVGTRFEHGEDQVPGGRQVCDPVAVFDAGAQGKRFWCEIAAYSMIQSASAVGWPARMITASSNGYRWDHAVAELWSNQFNKWFAVDTDFNIVFEVDGVPLSAWELVHQGRELRQASKLVVRRFAKFKEGLNPQDVLRLYRYTHLDLRNDWCTRDLRVGSPAGGDRATRWTSRKGEGPSFTVIPQASSASEFDWKLNNISVSAAAPDGTGTASRNTLVLSTHSPVFSHFEIRRTGQAWARLDGNRLQTSSSDSNDAIEARVVTRRGDFGPVATIRPSDLSR